jgi:hypothetical protein
MSFLYCQKSTEESSNADISRRQDKIQNILDVASYLNNICVLIDVYQKTQSIHEANQERWTDQMPMLRGTENQSQKRLKCMKNDKNKRQWCKVDAELVCFPILNREYVQNIHFGNLLLISTSIFIDIFLYR